jgi:hypothetical protein
MYPQQIPLSTGESCGEAHWWLNSAKIRGMLLLNLRYFVKPALSCEKKLAVSAYLNLFPF